VLSQIRCEPSEVASPHDVPLRGGDDGYLDELVSATSGSGSGEQRVHPREVKLYTGEQILENYEVYVGRRNATGKVVGSFVDDSEGRELYLGYVRQDRCAMWVRIPDEENVPKALRALADHNYVHTRYYGSGQQTDFNVS
jgi:hypothetical protein